MAKPDASQVGVPLTAWQLVGTTVTIIASILYMIWLLWTDVRTNYLTIREHNEFVERFNSDVTRLAKEQISQNRLLADRIETRESQYTARLALEALDKRLEQMQNQIDRLSQREDSRHLHIPPDK